MTLPFFQGVLDPDLPTRPAGAEAFRNLAGQDDVLGLPRALAALHEPFTDVMVCPREPCLVEFRRIVRVPADVVGGQRGFRGLRRNTLALVHWPSSS